MNRLDTMVYPLCGSDAVFLDIIIDAMVHARMPIVDH